MARPKKNNADYFSHDKDMRDDRKIKALRSKFGILGYGVWCMLLEYLTGANNNEMQDEDIEIELISGDFGISVTEMTDIIEYCCRLKLLTRENGIIYSKSLKDRLAPVYEKRARAKAYADKQTRVNGKFSTETTEEPIVSVTETPQSKVKESKVKYLTIYLKGEKRLIFESLNPLMNEILSDQCCIEDFQRISGNPYPTVEAIQEKVKEFFVKLTVDGEQSKERKDAIYHFKSWLNGEKQQVNNNKAKNYGAKQIQQQKIGAGITFVR